jgi:hypothetical protein
MQRKAMWNCWMKGQMTGSAASCARIGHTTCLISAALSVAGSGVDVKFLGVVRVVVDEVVDEVDEVLVEVGSVVDEVDDVLVEVGSAVDEVDEVLVEVNSVVDEVDDVEEVLVDVVEVVVLESTDPGAVRFSVQYQPYTAAGSKARPTPARLTLGWSMLVL